jgi:hypothetical protein
MSNIRLQDLLSTNVTKFPAISQVKFLPPIFFYAPHNVSMAPLDGKIIFM